MPLQDEEQFIEKYICSVYNKALGELLTLHKLLLVTIESLKTEIQYYITQLLIYAETTPDAEPATIAGLGGMRYRLDGRRQETMRQIRALYHPLEPVKEDEANDAVTIDPITILDDWSKSDSQSTRASDGLFSTDPDHEQMKINEESEVQSYGEARLMTVSLNALKTGEVEHLRHKIIDQEQKAVQQIPELQ